MAATCLPVTAPARWPAPDAANGDPTDRQSQHWAKKQAILLAAARQFREHGFEATSLNDIARHLAVSKPTLYYYLRNKEDILVGCQANGYDELLGQAREIDASSLCGRDKLRRMMVCYASWITTDFGICVVRLWNVRVSADTRRQLDEARADLQARVRGMIDEGMNDGSLARCDVSAAMSALFGAFNWLGQWYEPGLASTPPAELGERYMNIFLHGMAAASHPISSGAAGVETRTRS